MKNNKNKYDIEALRGLLNKLLSDSGTGEDFNISQSNQFQEAEILKMLQQDQMQQMQQMQQQNQQQMQQLQQKQQNRRPRF